MTKSLVCLVVAAGVAQADPNPAELAGSPPATANHAAGGVMWTTLIAGHGAHPKSTDWVAYYGDTSHESRESYYTLRVRQPSGFRAPIDVTSMALGEKRRWWIPASGPSPATVEDVELVAIVGPTQPKGWLLFPPPGDAQVAATGDRFVIVNDGKPSKVRAEPPDRVLFSVIALDKDGNHVDLGVKPGSQPLADVGAPLVVDTLRDMNPGEQRRVWTRRGGRQLMLHVTLYSVEKRPQVPAPRDVARPPASAVTAPGVRYVVVALGSGEPIDAADDVTLDYAVWSPTGRTIETFAGTTQVAGGFQFRQQLSEMRVGERRRIWMDAATAGYYSESGRGAVVDVTVVAVHRNVELLPGGLRIRHARDVVEVVRGTTTVQLPLPIVELAGAKLAAGSLTFTGDDTCGMPVTVTMPLTELEARLDDVEARHALDAGNAAAAIASGTHALGLAPEIHELSIHLARAYLRDGNRHGAAQTLAQLAARNPMWVAWQAHEQADLTSLLGEPELARLHVRAPATIDLTKQRVLVERGGRFVAVLVTEGSWGSGDAETRIEIFDMTTAQIAASIPRVAWSYVSQPMTPAIDAEVARREHEVAAWLADLGFAAPKGMETGAIHHVGRGDPTAVAFPKSGVTVTEAGEIMRGKKVVAPGLPMWGFASAAYVLPAERVLVYVWGRAGHEGCEGTDPQGAVAVRAP